MTRLEDWPERLAAFFASDEPFVWGKRDCCLFVCDAILEMTGADVASDFRGKYSTELGAAKFIHRMGGVESIAAHVTEQFGMPEIAVRMARRGDVAFIGTQNALAIIGLNGYAVAQGKDGLKRVERSALTRAWRV